MDIEKWRSDYPFFNKIWNLYGKFNEPVKENGYPPYTDLCKHISSNYREDRQKQNDICMKVLRNLWLISDDPDEDMINSLRCTYLNIWLYYQSKINNFPDDFINQIFSISKGMLDVLPDSYECTYDSSFEKKFEEPESIIKLNNFVDNIEIVESALLGERGINYFTCLNYVKECVTIYSEMKATYCMDADDVNNRFKDTCEELSTFKNIYTSELYNKVQKDEIVPSLSSIPLVPRVRFSQERRDKASISSEHDDSVNPVTGAISTVGGSVVGMGTFLLLMYQFTPFRSWVRSRVERQKGIGDHLDREEMDHMCLNGHGNNSIYSDDMGYNMGYNAM
ncbi:PIR Superfamily Protein [Plasmodium ovale wallikeri]|uniref:PIR Superfamily Protein n=2 Tax=Plasmodium ovale TaxID=36330 RepID=A0A1A9AQS5_PLAOA|nr:PIR Superfamily Protein [Plasmodium ovale wallikeri]SBT59568.1 PIR Superfamily Protein [Plasmodium ovale wallikeri]SBT73891.1 PIR protein [Plasmodium ovale]